MAAATGMDATRAGGPPGDAAERPPADEGANRTRNYAIILAILIVILLVAGYLFARNLGYLGELLQPVGGGPAVLRGHRHPPDDGLNVDQVQQVSNDAAGTVISTDPAPTRWSRRGTRSPCRWLWPPRSPRCPSPPVSTGLTVSQAQAQLAGVGLTWTVKPVPSSTIPKGIVESSDPAAGVKVAQGTSVILTVSSGVANVSVPSVAGLGQIAAGNVLGQAGLTDRLSDQPVLHPVRRRPGHRDQSSGRDLGGPG